MMPTSSRPSHSPPVQRRSPSLEALNRCYQAFESIRLIPPSESVIAQRTQSFAQEQAVAREVDIFLTTDSPSQRAHHANRLLQRNFETTSAAPKSEAHDMVIRCVDTTVDALDPLYSSLRQWTAMRMGSDFLEEQCELIVERNCAHLRLIPGLEAQTQRELTGLLERSARQVYTQLPSVSAYVYGIRMLFSDAEISLLLRCPNQRAIADGRQRAKAMMGGTAHQQNDTFALTPQERQALRPVQLGEDYTRFLAALELRGPLYCSVAAKAQALDSTLTQNEIAVVVNRQLLRDKPILLSCYKDIDVDAFESYQQTPGVREALHKFYTLHPDTLAVWARLAGQNFEATLAHNVAAFYEGRYV